MSRQKLQHRRKLLERKLKDLSVVSANRSDLFIVPSSDPIEHAQSQSSMDVTVRVLTGNWRVGRAIRSALARIDSGEFGICETCGEPIAPKRLDAIPWATVCTPCQSFQEAEEGSGRLLQEVA